MRVGLLVTCLVDLMRPSIAMSAIKLLEFAGCEVLVPRAQTCCGQPGYNCGDRRSALALARKLLQEFASCDYVVAPSGSCAAMVRVHFPRILSQQPGERDRAAVLCANTYELTDFLVNVANVSSLPARFDGSVTYHDACSGLRELGIKAQPRALLRMVKGLRLVEMHESEACCGFGGAFAVKFGDISTRLADNKCEHALAVSADAIVLGDLGCMLNIEGRLRRRGERRTRVLHIAEVLAGAPEA